MRDASDGLRIQRGIERLYEHGHNPLRAEHPACSISARVGEEHRSARPKPVADAGGVELDNGVGTKWVLS